MKAVKEHETYTACLLPSQSISIIKYLPYKENKGCYLSHIWIVHDNKTTMAEDFQESLCTTKLTPELLGSPSNYVQLKWLLCRSIEWMYFLMYWEFNGSLAYGQLDKLGPDDIKPMSCFYQLSNVKRL